MAGVFFAAAFLVDDFLAAAFLAAVFLAAVFLAGSFAPVSLPVSPESSPRASLAAATDFCSAASRSTTSPEDLVAVGVRFTSPP